MPRRAEPPAIPPEPRWELADDGSHYGASWPDTAVMLEVRRARRDRYGDPRSDITVRFDGKVIHQADINPFNQRDRVDFHALASQRDGHIPWESYLLALLPRLRAILEQQATSEAEGSAELRKPLVVCMAAVDPEAVTWLWEPYIPRGKLTLLEGDPGVGKTWLALALAAAVTRGKRPFHEEALAPGTVLYMTAEDGLADTLRPRLDAAGADVTRVHVLTGWQSDSDQGGVSLADIDVIEAAVRQTGATLVVIDPLQAYLGGRVDMHRANETRPILMALAALAERCGCAVLLIRHLSKTLQDRAIYRGLGSIDFAGAARSILLAGQHPQVPQQRVLAQSKNSLEAMGPSLAYEVKEGQFVWLGRSDVTAEALVRPALAEEERSAGDEAADWLATALEDGPRPSKDLLKAAKAAGLAERTIWRAKDQLKVRARRRNIEGQPRGSGEWVWSLPPDQPCHDGRPAHTHGDGSLEAVEETLQNQ